MRRELAEWAQQAHDMSQWRAAGLIPVNRSTLRYEHHRDSQEALRVRLRELAGSRVRYSYRRLTVMLKREGWEVNAKRIVSTPKKGRSCERNAARNVDNDSVWRKCGPCTETKSGVWISSRSDWLTVGGFGC
jgi:hypothetical protein